MRLSLCMATFNRGRFIGQTLDSIVGQLHDGVELVIVDGASSDDTPAVVSGYVDRHPAIRYFREPKNSGVDADFDKAVGYAAGEHCWLITDDDLLAPSAVERALEALDQGSIDVLVVDSETRDASLTRTFRARRLRFSGGRTYGAGDDDSFLSDAGDVLSFIGGTIIRRRLWMARQRERYFGSLFIHVGVIFQRPAPARMKILGEPLVRIRCGNAMWSPRSFEIWAFKWPELIWGFEGYSDDAKRCVTAREPWKGLVWICDFRARGAYSIAEYRRYFSARSIGLWRPLLLLVAVAPGWLVNFLFVLLLVILGRRGGEEAYELAVSSRHSSSASRWLGGFRAPS